MGNRRNTNRMKIWYLVKNPKKGYLQECKNYRGIMLLSVPEKVLNQQNHIGKNEK